MVLQNYFVSHALSNPVNFILCDYGKVTFRSTLERSSCGSLFECLKLTVSGNPSCEMPTDERVPSPDWVECLRLEGSLSATRSSGGLLSRLVGE